MDINNIKPTTTLRDLLHVNFSSVCLPFSIDVPSYFCFFFISVDHGVIIGNIDNCLVMIRIFTVHE